MLKCIIIDDEPLATELLHNYAVKSNDLEVIGVFHDPLAAIHALKEIHVDIIFLDIQMPELTGIQLMKIFKTDYHFILTTAYEEYALEGYEHNVVDYLLKPISFERFLTAVEKAKDRIAIPRETEHAALNKTKDYIFVKSGYKTLKINIDDILFLEGMGDYLAIHTKDQKILTLENLGHYESLLPEERFVRTHRSYIVAIPKIDFIERNRIKINDQIIPVSNKYHDEFWRRIQ